jgi:hypothetical protein
MWRARGELMKDFIRNVAATSFLNVKGKVAFVATLSHVIIFSSSFSAPQHSPTMIPGMCF